MPVTRLVLAFLLATGQTPSIARRGDGVNHELELAVLKGGVARAKRLLRDGADPNYVVRTPHAGSIPVVALAAGFGHGDSKREAIARELVALLVRAGARLDPDGEHEVYPLASPVIYGDIAAVGVLLENGADVNARGNDGTTPLMIAAGMGQERVIRYLIARGADTCARDDAGRTVRDYFRMSETFLKCETRESAESVERLLRCERAAGQER